VIAAQFKKSVSETLFDEFFEFTMYDGVLLVVLRGPTIIMFELVDVIFPPPGVDTKVEVLSVGAPFL
jgi:hypothetical protein